MAKEELRALIQSTSDGKVLDALWELYELKFCMRSLVSNTKDVLTPYKQDGFIYSNKSVLESTL